MNEYLKRYIELKKQFVATNNSPDSVRSLYAFKEELEYMEGSRQRKYWWMYMTYWTLRRMPTTCSVKSEIAPIKKHSSGWVR